MMMRLHSMLLLLCVAAGCGRTPAVQPAAAVRNAPSHAEAAPPAPPLDAAAKDGRPVIVAFGDSLTAGYGAAIGKSYPDYLQHDLDSRGYHYRVVNAGHSGDTSKDGLTRLPSVLAEHPAVVILAFGGNDGLRGAPVAETEMNLRTMIAALQQAHAKVILGGITLPPNYGTEYIARFNAMYRQLAAEFHIPLLPFMLKNVYGVPGDMQADGIHATALGNQQVAKNFLPLLLPVLHRRGASTSPEIREATAGQP